MGQRFSVPTSTPGRTQHLAKATEQVVMASHGVARQEQATRPSSHEVRAERRGKSGSGRSTRRQRRRRQRRRRKRAGGVEGRTGGRDSWEGEGERGRVARAQWLVWAQHSHFVRALQQQSSIVESVRAAAAVAGFQDRARLAQGFSR